METSRENEASSSSSSIPPKFKYDVFLSFSGQDTRNNFTSHLLAALEQHGFHTFRDDTKLNRGENIGQELMKAIEESRISLVILSRNYAASKWCLDELVKIMECRKTLRQTVLPIFYNVDPSDVRAQKGSLAEAFAKHEECLEEGSSVRMEKWREALTEVANLSGWDVPNVANGDEAQLIRKAVEEVQNKLDLEYSDVACHIIGLESRLQKMKLLLNMESNGVRIVAIWGMGGIGKTTIAKRLFDLIQHKFEGSSFLENIRETWKQPNGQSVLQEQLLSDILKSGTPNLRNRHQRINIIKRRAFCRKVLLILDDVDDVEQLKALAIDRGSFGFGSRIVVTTRDISSLNLLKVDEKYAVEEFNEDESLELFKWHCFKDEDPTEDRLDLSGQVVQYAGGVPLALEVLGSYFYDKSIPEWKSAISKLIKIPHDKIQQKLKISFDSLGEEEKKLFLDIACFFVGTDGGVFIKILESCEKFAVNGIRELANRCLVKYHDNKLVMHDVVRDMGREIVRQESLTDPGRRSRLWYIEDVLDILRDGMGTEVVEGCLLNYVDPKDVQINPKAFEKMSNLWLLHLDHVNVTTGYEHISRRLLWLSWKGFPLQCVPWNLSMERLVALDLSYSNLQKVLVKLKFLYLSHCHYLTRTPNFLGLESLEELFLNDCKSLVEVDESIMCLNKLIVLDMNNCTKLQKLPDILKLKSLQHLDLSHCSMLGKYSGLKGSPWKSLTSFLSALIFRTKRMDSIGSTPYHAFGSTWLTELRMANCNLLCLPDEVGNLISLEKLDLSGNNLRTLPDSFCNLRHLKNLLLVGCNLTNLPSKIGKLISLKTLDLRANNLITLPDSLCNLAGLQLLKLKDCNLSNLPERIGRLSSLLYLDLRRNNFCSLPNSFSDLPFLMHLDVSGCIRLKSLPQLPIHLCRVNAMYCTSLESIIPTEFNDQSRQGNRLIHFQGCKKLPTNIVANDVTERKNMDLLEQVSSKDSTQQTFSICYHVLGDEVPDYFQYRYTGSKFRLVVPPQETWTIRGYSLCVVFRTSENLEFSDRIFHICFNNPRLDCIVLSDMSHRGQDQMVLLRVNFPKIHLYGRDILEIVMKPDRGNTELLTVKKWGVSLIDKRNSEMPMKRRRKITEMRIKQRRKITG